MQPTIREETVPFMSQGVPPQSWDPFSYLPSHKAPGLVPTGPWGSLGVPGPPWGRGVAEPSRHCPSCHISCRRGHPGRRDTEDLESGAVRKPYQRKVDTLPSSLAVEPGPSPSVPQPCPTLPPSPPWKSRSIGGPFLLGLTKFGWHPHLVVPSWCERRVACVYRGLLEGLTTSEASPGDEAGCPLLGEWVC